MTTAADLADLTRLAAILRLQNDSFFHAVADKIDAYRDGQFDSLDAALGIKRGPGMRTPDTPDTIARYKRRNAAIVAASDKYPGTPAEIGRALHSALLRYQQSRWQWEKDQMDAPPNHLHFWTILAASDGQFPGAMRLAQIIRHRK
jgi:hypothetical protein